MHRLPLLLSALVIVLWGVLEYFGVGDPEPVPPYTAEEAAAFFERRAGLNCPATTDELFQLGQAWFNDTSALSPVVLDSISPRTQTVYGTGHAKVDFSLRQDGATTYGSKALRYRVALEASHRKLILRLTDARVDGRPPENDTTWVTLPPPPRRLPWQERATTAEEMMWYQVCLDVAAELDQLPHHLRGYLRQHVAKPGAQEPDTVYEGSTFGTER